MSCYECRKAGTDSPAVALCECGAGLCFDHARETAVWRRDAARIVGCQHDIWLLAAEARTTIAEARPRPRLVPRMA
jgi:hypothetical protein